jgi:hypothetical protein
MTTIYKLITPVMAISIFTAEKTVEQRRAENFFPLHVDMNSVQYMVFKFFTSHPKTTVFFKERRKLLIALEREGSLVPPHGDTILAQNRMTSLHP